MKQLLIFDEINSWIVLPDDVKIKVDYCNVSQHYKLNSIISSWLDEKDETKKSEYEYLMVYYTIKYQLKDWDGIGKDNDTKLELELVNNEVSDKIMNAIATNPSLFWQIFNAINQATKFDNNDKKK